MKRNNKIVCIVVLTFFCLNFLLVDYIYSAGKNASTKVIEKASFKVVFYEILGGMAGPFVTAIDLINQQGGLNCCNCGEFINRGYLITPIILFPLSIPYGVYVVGRNNNQGGSYWAALLGSLVLMGSWAGATSNSEMDNTTIGLGYYFLDVLGSVIGYNLFKPKPTIKARKSNLEIYCMLPQAGYCKNKDGYKFNLNIFEIHF